MTLEVLLSLLQRGLNNMREIRVFETFGELSKEVLKYWKKKSTNKFIFHEQQLKVAYISVVILDQLSPLFDMKQREFRKTQRLLSYKRKNVEKCSKINVH